MCQEYEDEIYHSVGDNVVDVWSLVYTVVCDEVSDQGAHCVVGARYLNNGKSQATHLHLVRDDPSYEE